MAYQDGNRRPGRYMRERYLHITTAGSGRAAKRRLQLIWGDGDLANIELGRALHREVPAAGYTELAGLGHFLLMEDPEAVGNQVREALDRES
jgi:pimeloyl-ACP methyl ester carboxylesterase